MAPQGIDAVDPRIPLAGKRLVKAFPAQFGFLGDGGHPLAKNLAEHPEDFFLIARACNRFFLVPIREIVTLGQAINHLPHRVYTITEFRGQTLPGKIKYFSVRYGRSQIQRKGFYENSF